MSWVAVMLWITGAELVTIVLLWAVVEAAEG